MGFRGSRVRIPPSRLVKANARTALSAGGRSSSGMSGSTVTDIRRAGFYLHDAVLLPDVKDRGALIRVVARDAAGNAGEGVSPRFKIKAGP